jgi:hypothetical protein
MTGDKAKALRAPFPPEQIGKLPKGGVMLDYVGHAAVTDRLLQVDAGWSWEPYALDEHGLPAVDKEGNLWIRLTIDGVTRPGVGDGKNAKERISDAIRNAAMRFGVALDLWAKEDLNPDGGAATAKTAPSSTRAVSSKASKPVGGEKTADGGGAAKTDTTSLAVRFLEITSALDADVAKMQELAKQHDGDKAWFEEQVAKGEKALASKAKLEPEQESAFPIPTSKRKAA